MSGQGQEIRDAATIILVRDAATAPRILMGQRGASAIFMPDKFVFPGGAVDASDVAIAVDDPLPDPCRARLSVDSDRVQPETLAMTAIRELFEETGHILGKAAIWPDAPADWSDFAAQGFRPATDGLRFFFRAVTPPGRLRRFDARFFLADAGALATHPDAMAAASDELSHLKWVSLDEARALNLAFVTQLVLGEVASHLPSLDAPATVPYIRNDSLSSDVTWL